MELTLEYVDIKDIQFGDRTYIDNGMLFINKEELISRILADPDIKKVEIGIARPGEKTRVINIVDAIEPRAKINSGANWAGLLADFSETPGTGITRVLKGMSILMCDPNHLWKKFNGILDMAEPGAKWSPYSKLNNLCITCYSEDGADFREFALKIRRACMAIAVDLAKCAPKVDRVEILNNEKRTPGLPNIAYYFQMYSNQHVEGHIPEPIFYGFELPDTLPLVIQPTEVVDGAIWWGYSYHMMETYSIQNNPVIFELMRRHGKELNFVGMMVGVCTMDGKRRDLAGMMIGNTMKEVFHADGVILTKTQGGAPHVCVGVAASECEKRGIKTVPMHFILNDASNLTAEVFFSDPKLNAIVQGGAYTQDDLVFPPVENVFGGPRVPITTRTGIISPDPYGEVTAQTLNILGCCNHVGFSNLIAVDY